MPSDDLNARSLQAANTAEIPRWMQQARNLVMIAGFVIGLVWFATYKLNLQLPLATQQFSTIFVIGFCAGCTFLLCAMIIWAFRKSQLRDSLAGRLVLAGLMCLYPFYLVVLFAVFVAFVIYPTGEAQSVAVPLIYAILIVIVCLALLGICLILVGGTLRIVEAIR